MTESIATIELADDEEFLRLPDVQRKTGLSRSTIYARMIDGAFPDGHKYPGSRTTFWLLSDVREWQREQLRAAVA